MQFRDPIVHVFRPLACFRDARAIPFIGLITVIGIATPAFAQDAANFGQDKSQLGHMARTIDIAMEWGSTFDLDEKDITNLSFRGGSPTPDECVAALDCAQPGDLRTVVNVSFFDTAEILEFSETGTLNEVCMTFVGLGGGCPTQPSDTAWNQTWSIEFFEVDAAGIPNSTAADTFSTEFPLGNMAVLINAPALGLSELPR